tara:strand:+ start:3296 stop:3451 length:156 start_codon:yes stop_codon:yes gene_type:complete
MSKPEIKFHKSTKTYSFGRYKHLTLAEAEAKQKKYEICVSQLRSDEQLICY